jgi:CHAT domain-containing protein/Tfp pilus assembly protein PilF
MRIALTIFFTLTVNWLTAQNIQPTAEQQAVTLFEQGRLAEAYEQAWREGAIIKTRYGVISDQYAKNLRLLSEITATIGHDSLALQYARQEVECRKMLEDINQYELAQAYQNVGRRYLSLDDTEAARLSVQQSLSLADTIEVAADSLTQLQFNAAQLYQLTQAYRLADSLYTFIQKQAKNGQSDSQLVVKARYYQSLMYDTFDDSIGQELMNQLRKQGDTATTLYAALCYQRANLALEQEDWLRARTWYQAARKVFERDSLPLNAVYASVLNNLGVIALADGEIGIGGQYWEEAYSLSQNVDQYEEGRFWIALANLASYYHENGNATETLALYEKHLASEDTMVNYPWEYAVVVNNAAAIFQNEGNYRQAGEYFSRAIKVLENSEIIEKKALLHQASIYSNAARNYQDLVRFDTAIYYHQKSIELIKQAAGRESQEYVAAISGIAGLYHDIGYLVEAGIFFQEAINIQKELTGTEHDFYANLLNNYALVCQAKGNYRKAAELLEKSIATKEKLFGAEHPDYLAALSNVGLLYLEEGKYTQSRPILELVTETQREKWGDEHPVMIDNYLNLARLEILTGNYPEAEPLLQQASRLALAHFGENHPEHARVQLEMAKFYFTLGNFTTAKPLLEVSQQIFQDAYGSFHPDLAAAYQSLASLYEAQDSIELAEQYYRKALAIDESTLGKQHPSYAVTLSNLATLYQNNDRYEQALPLLEESLSISEQILGKEHPFYSTTLLNLGLLYQDLLDYQKATNYIEEAVSVRREVLGELHPDYAYALYSQAVLYHKLEQYEQAEEVFHQVINNYVQQIHNYFPALSEKEKSAYFQRVEPVFHAFRDFVIDQVYYRETEVSEAKKQRLLGELYNLQLVTKAMLLDASYQLRQAIASQSNTQTVRQYEQWLAIKEQLGQAYTLSRRERNEQDIDLASLEDEANQLEKQLSRESATFAITVDSKQVTWQQVQSQLSSEEAAVEIIRIAKDSSTLYAALLLESETEALQLCMLPEGETMENKNFYYYQNAVKFRISDELSYQQYWQPIQDQLSDQILTVYLAPDGVYHKINISSLYNPNAQRYVIDEVDIRIVSSTRDLTQSGYYTSTQPQQAYLVGYPDFQNQVEYQDSEANIDTTVALLGNPVSVLQNTPFAFGISDLPGTQLEVEVLDRLLKKKQWVSNTYLAEEANEKVVKSVDSPRLLHIATHGYFMTDLPVADNGRAYGIHLQNISANPLLRAGLLLAGAERSIHQKNPTDWQAEDGILTAYEAMNLQLNGTELVVLSACETGLGDIKNGEGVYGLQRSFLVAGAQNVLMSLWSVSDNSTAELMQYFYQYWLSGQNKHVALRNAQLAIKEQRPDPYYWGGFVLIGR